MNANLTPGFGRPERGNPLRVILAVQRTSPGNFLASPESDFYHWAGAQPQRRLSHLSSLIFHSKGRTENFPSGLLRQRYFQMHVLPG